MNVSFNWLKELAPGLEGTPEELADRLAMYGAPVDAIEPVGEGLADIVVARVERVRPHPNADRLSLCEVDAGTGEVQQVVCGAPNVRAGAYYPFAPVGAPLPGGITIRRARIRGEESNGMLCSERELGLGRDHTGILELHGTYTPGERLTAALGLDDVRIVVDVTPNRGDLLSHIGVARELAPGGEAGIRLAPFPTASGEAADGPALADAPALRTTAGPGTTGGVKITIEDTRGCPRYIGAVIRGVTIGPSPDWLASRLRAVGLRPINNVVDATNYVLYELGQPLHAFDLDRLEGPEIVVRRARPGETIVTLDGQRRVLDADMTVIADATRPVAIAGVMGGEDSEVGPETRNVLLECALFDPRSIRRTRRALGMSTDASARFERGVDPEGMERAIRRALALIQVVAGGTIEPVIADVHPSPRQAPVLKLRPARVSHLLGIALDVRQITSCLEPIGFQVTPGADGVLDVRVPGHRWGDVEREVDLIEEVARRYGYDAFPETLRPFRPSSVPDDAVARLENRLRERFVARGFLEARTAAFAPESEGDVALLLPLSSAESRLRRDLVPGLIHRVEYNFARGVRHIRLFEIGTVFAPGPTPADPPLEATRVAAVFTGSRQMPHWSGNDAAYDLWDLKALMTEIAEALGPDLIVEPDDSPRPVYESGLYLRIVDGDGRKIGEGGRVASSAVDAPAWASDVWAFEIELRPELAVRRPVTFQPLPAYPAIERDLALLVPDEIPAAGVEAVIREAGGQLLEAVWPFDLYRGRGVPAGSRSIAFRLRFRAADRTLTDRDADAATARVLRRLKDELGIERRV